MSQKKKRKNGKKGIEENVWFLSGIGGAEELKRKKFNLTIDICFIIGYNGTIESEEYERNNIL